eukprot:TRINITY_DN4072_c0_g1_i1.p1 TRINITY_DN4072_c0_g1~~TRINITY_DN4072_c0_g1_i1.p1  ORF type:complete len:1629 (-),score=393.18 TRINITY_DN4072_c0_g1_i1:50-4558(-)
MALLRLDIFRVKLNREITPKEMKTLSEIAAVLEYLPMAMDLTHPVLESLRITPKQLLEKLKEEVDVPEEKGKKHVRRQKKAQPQPIERVLTDPRFISPSPLKALLDVSVSLLERPKDNVVESASHFAHGELAIAILEVSGWFGPQEIPIELLSIAAHKIRAVKTVGTGLLDGAAAAATQLAEDVLDFVTLRNVIDDDEDDGSLEHFEVSCQKLEDLGLLRQNDSTRGMSAHALLQEYARSRPRSLDCAKAVLSTLVDGQCRDDTVDHYTSLWSRRTFLESQGFPIDDIFMVGYRLATHLSPLNEGKKVLAICEEALLRGKGLSDIRFGFWQLKASHLLAHDYQRDLAIHEMQRCLRSMPKELLASPLALLLETQIVHGSVEGGYKTLPEVRDTCLALSRRVEVLHETIPRRDPHGPYGEYLHGGPGEVLALVNHTLGLIDLQHDLRPDVAVRLLDLSSEMYKETTASSSGKVLNVYRDLSTGYNNLMYRALASQLLHDAFRIVEDGVPTDLMKDDRKGENLDGHGGNLAVLGRFAKFSKKDLLSEPLEESSDSSGFDSDGSSSSSEGEVFVVSHPDEYDQRQREEEAKRAADTFLGEWKVVKGKIVWGGGRKPLRRRPAPGDAIGNRETEGAEKQSSLPQQALSPEEKILSSGGFQEGPTDDRTRLVAQRALAGTAQTGAGRQVEVPGAAGVEKCGQQGEDDSERKDVEKAMEGASEASLEPEVRFNEDRAQNGANTADNNDGEEGPAVIIPSRKIAFGRSLPLDGRTAKGKQEEDVAEMIDEIVRGVEEVNALRRQRSSSRTPGSCSSTSLARSPDTGGNPVLFPYVEGTGRLEGEKRLETGGDTDRDVGGGKLEQGEEFLGRERKEAVSLSPQLQLGGPSSTYGSPRREEDASPKFGIGSNSGGDLANGQLGGQKVGRESFPEGEDCFTESASAAGEEQGEGSVSQDSMGSLQVAGEEQVGLPRSSLLCRARELRGNVERVGEHVSFKKDEDASSVEEPASDWRGSKRHGAETGLQGVNQVTQLLKSMKSVVTDSFGGSSNNDRSFFEEVEHDLATMGHAIEGAFGEVVHEVAGAASRAGRRAATVASTFKESFIHSVGIRRHKVQKGRAKAKRRVLNGQIFNLQEEQRKLYEALLAAKWPRNGRVLGDVHFSEEQRSKAETVFLKYLASMANQHGLDGATTVARLTLTQRKKGEYGQKALVSARHALEEAIGDAELHEETTDEELAEALVNLAVVYERLELLAHSQRAMEHAVSLAKRSRPELLPRRRLQLAYVLIRKGNLLQARGELEQATMAFLEEGERGHGGLASALTGLGVAEWLEGHPAAAQGYLQDACRIITYELGADHVMAADLLSCVARCQLARAHDVDGAITNWRRVLAIYRKELVTESGKSPALAFALTDLVLAMERMVRLTAIAHIRQQQEAYQRVAVDEEGRQRLADGFLERAKQMLRIRKELAQDLKDFRAEAMELINEHKHLPEMRVLRKLLHKKQGVTAADINM